MSNRVATPLLIAAAAAAIGFAALREMAPASGPDYCAAANLRTCKVEMRGDWIILSAGQSAYLVLMQGGKIVQVQQIQ
ncbi:MAG TPA: hypothetical protein VGR43_04930 [Dehalococcoidia bacterium]|nr:hypothetical protein [Dehalococcoidia bacterium]